MTQVVQGILIPFLGTTLGAACALFLKNNLPTSVQRILTGFAAGIMTAASVWSLLIPALEQESDRGRLAFLPAAIGFLVGIAFLLLLDRLIPHLHMNSKEAEGIPARLKKTTMLVFAVTLHNIPEGMAVGVVYAGVLYGHQASITAAGALALSLGIAIQNFPEGAIISMPLRARYAKIESVFIRYVVRRCRTAGSIADDFSIWLFYPVNAVSAEFCCRSNAVCSRGGTDSRDVRGEALQCRNNFVCSGICCDDDFGYCLGITYFEKDSKKMKKALDKFKIVW